MLEIFIPSTQRSYKMETPNYIPEKYKTHTTIVVNYEDWWAYQRFEDQGFRVMPLPPDLHGISPCRRYIMDHAERLGLEKIAMLDDDLQFYVRKSADDWHLRYCEHEDMLDLFETIEESLEEEIPLIGVSPREGNNWVKNDWQFNVRLIRFLAFHVPTCQKLAKFSDESDGLKVMEDFHYILQVLKAGYQNANLFQYAQGQKGGTQAAGGCSTYRTHENHAASAELLASLHPDCCELVTKENKTGGEFGKRTEVRIRWKDAYAIGRRARSGEPDPYEVVLD